MSRRWHLRPQVELRGGWRQGYAAIGPPGSGKTGWLALCGLEAPGPCLMFSTRPDLAQLTARRRAAVGPVWWVNPRRAGGFPSDCGFTPLAGCHDTALAMEAAGALMAAAPHDAKDAAWDAWSKVFLQYLLHAAALDPHGGCDIGTVRRWAADPESCPAAMELLDAYGAEGWAQGLDDLGGMCAADADGKTAAAIAHGARAALAWLDDPALARLACPPPGLAFDFAAWLEQSGTVFLIGSESEHNPMQPYLSCLLTYCWNRAKEAAHAGAIRERIVIIGDEPGNTCLVPYDKWASTAGGDGVTLITGWQSTAQMPMRWGEHAGKVMLDAFTCLLVFGGVKGALAEEASSWAATKPTWTRGDSGARVWDEAATFSPAALGTLDPFRAMVKYRHVRPALTDLPDPRAHRWCTPATGPDFPQAPCWDVPGLAPGRRRPLPGRVPAGPPLPPPGAEVELEGGAIWLPAPGRRALPGPR